MNPLNDFPTARKYAYYVQFVVAGLITLLALGFAAADLALPTWYVVTAAVTQGLWSYLGLTAGQNVTGSRRRHRGEAGESPILTALAVVVLALLVLALVGALPLGR